jgi:ABC-type dipeptide/oligopeptide/nickel transport system ATPase component
MAFTFSKATKKRARLRLGLAGPSGSGKTYTALAIATALAGDGGRVAVIDTEHGSANRYAGLFDFDALDLESFSPLTYVQAIQAAAEHVGPSGVVIVDSLSHAWMGKDGALEQVDRAGKRGANSYTAWRDVTPQHNALIEALLACPAHLVATLRSKTEYVLEEDSKGKKVPRKVGMAPIQRDGMEYEFDVFADMTLDNDFCVSKARCPELAGAVIRQPGRDVARRLKAWLSDGVDTVAKPVAKLPDAEPIGYDDAARDIEDAQANDDSLALATVRDRIVVGVSLGQISQEQAASLRAQFKVASEDISARCRQRSQPAREPGEEGLPPCPRG